MTSRRHEELNHSTLRTLAATVGALPVAIALGVVLTFTLPLPANLRLSIGSYAVFPIWTGTACFTFLAPNARRAWLLLLAALLGAGLILLLCVSLGHAPSPDWSR